MSAAQSALHPAGAQAAATLGLFHLLLWVCAAAYLLVLTFLAAALWRGSRSGDPSEAPPVHLSAALWGWTGLIVVGLTALVIGSFVVDRGLAAARARETLTLRVTGHQWWWRVQYRDATGGWIETANELHLPVGETARVEVASSDVIHSLWIPNLAGKMDAIPGRANVLDVTPIRIGWVRGQCAEFCGAQHAHMALDVDVQSPADFRTWLAAQAQPAVQHGDATFAHGMAVVTGGACASCHAIRGTAASGRAGPDLTHLASRREIAAGLAPMSRGAIQGWILQPAALKPGTNMPSVPLSPADADAAATYLASLE